MHSDFYTDIDITLDSDASDSEMDAIKAVMREEGIQGSVRATWSNRSFGEAPWIICLSAPLGVFFYRFFATLGEEAGKAAYRGIRRLISRLFGTRRNSNGCIELWDDSTRTHIIFVDNLPEKAYMQLAQIGLEQLKGGYWTWDVKDEKWTRL